MICALAPIHGIRWMLDYANSEIPNTENRLWNEILMRNEKELSYVNFRLQSRFKAEPVGIDSQDKGGRIHGVVIIEKQGHEVTNFP